MVNEIRQSIMVSCGLERSACSVESKGASLVSDSYCVGRDLEQDTRTQLLSNITVSVPLRHVGAAELYIRRVTSKISCIV